MKRFYMPVLLALSSLASATAFAVPISFEFSIPFESGTLAGQPSTLTVSVENGANPFANQEYGPSRITGLAVSSGSLFMSFTGSPFDVLGEGVYVRTDSNGVPTLDVSTGGGRLVFGNVESSIQLGTSRFVNYGALFSLSANVNGTNFALAPTTGRAIRSVPEPATVLLLGSALALLWGVRSVAGRSRSA